jgi:sRNA-binding regulator protein Hfq
MTLGNVGAARAPRRPQRADQDSPARIEQKKKAVALAKDTGIPANLAHQVVLGNLKLNDVVERLAVRDRVDALVRKHDLPKSLATQIALGHADLDVVLQKRRLGAHLVAHRERSALVQAHEHGRVISLAVHNAEHKRGRITAVGQYEVTLALDSGEQEVIHKARIKYMVDDEQAKAVRNQLRRDKALPERCEPTWKPQDRYGCSDRRLFGLMDEQAEIQVTLREGEVLRGHATWMGRWEFGMVLPKKKVEVVIFRHALADLRRV